MDTTIHNDQLNSGDSAEDSQELWSTEAVSNFAELIAELQKVDLNSPLAELNATTISDNNGRRILL